MGRKLSDILELESQDIYEDEWFILSYSIMFDEILLFVYEKYKSGQIKTKHFGQYFQPIFRWLMKYHGDYSKAPKQTIKEVFRSYSKSLNKDTARIVEEYLDRLAEEFAKTQEVGVNPEFIKKEIIPRFVKRQEAEIVISNLQAKIQSNKIEDIDKIIKEYNPIVEEDFDPELGTVKPASIRAVRKYYGEEKDKNELFRLPGAIGSFIGPFSRSKLIAITGVEKSGKTHFMQEVGYRGVIHHKLKILDINLEMPIEDKQERLWQRLGNYALDHEHAGELIIPVFDCENNQFGTCEVRKRKLNAKDLLYSIDDLVSYNERRDWRVCQKCRNKQDKRAKKTKRFIPAIWFKVIKIKPISEKRIINTVKKFIPFGINNYRMRCFPRFSATLDDVITYIKTYTSKKNFKPDIIMIDYPDIMRPIEGNLMDRFNIDYNWKKCAGLSQELDALILLADQTIKSARGKRSIGVMDTSESKTKDAHLDMRITINSSELEKELGLQRVGMLFKRKGRLLNSEVMLTQRLETCHAMLDSEFWHNYNTHYPVSKEKKE